MSRSLVSDVRDTRGRFHSERHLHIVPDTNNTIERVPVVEKEHTAGDNRLGERNILARVMINHMTKRFKRLQPLEETVIPDNTNVVYMDEWKETK